MKRINTKVKIIILYSMLVIMSILLAGCESKKADNSLVTFNKSLNNKPQMNETEMSENGNIEVDGKDNKEYRQEYLILEINSKKETMRVYRYSNKMEYLYYYGMNTAFSNKYGNHTTIASFFAGDIVSLSGTDEQGKVMSVQKSDKVWTYEDISRFSFSDNGRVLTIADTNYEIDGETYVVSGNRKIEADEISQDDKLTVIGVDKKILSVVVTTGHGKIKLSNTGLFEGSFMQLNNDIFTEITKDMTVEVPEGKYTLAVANNGWGGSKEITVRRGETIKVDLNEIKGDGPKKGKIMFEVDVDSAQVYIDKAKVDIGKSIELTYGAHSLVVMAEGYTTWKKTLYVNSKEATIIITLQDEASQSTGSSQKPQSSESTGSSQKPQSSETTSSSQKPQSSDSTESTHQHETPQSPNRDTESSEQTESTQSSNSRESILSDYMTTISGLLESLD